MTYLRALDEEKLRTLFTWLRCMGMPVNRNFYREYSDAVLVAQLLKKLYPRFVDMHNYPTRLSHSAKMTNWQTLNYKVLNRIGLSLTNEQTDILARGTWGYVERLLWGIMNLKSVRSTTQTKSKRASQQETSSTNSGIKVIEKIGDSANKTPSGDTPKKVSSGDMTKKVTIQDKKVSSEDMTNKVTIQYKPQKASENELQQINKELRDKMLELEKMLKEKDKYMNSLTDRVSSCEKECRELKKVVYMCRVCLLMNMVKPAVFCKPKKQLRKHSKQRVRIPQPTKTEKCRCFAKAL